MADDAEDEARDTKGVTIRFPTDLLVKLREMARREDRSLNAQVIRLLRKLVDELPQ